MRNNKLVSVGILLTPLMIMGGWIVGALVSAQPLPGINHLAVVTAARAKYNSMTPGAERGWRIVNETALQLVKRGEAVGLYYKGKVGTHWNGYSADVLCYAPHTSGTVCPDKKGPCGKAFDILQDAEGAARPQWAQTTPSGHCMSANYRPPVGETPPEPPDPDPPPICPECPACPDCPACDTQGVLEAIDSLRLLMETHYEEEKKQTRPVEMQVPAFAGTARGTVGPAQ